jgi:protein ImuA
MIEELRQRLRRLEKPSGIVDSPAALPLGAPDVDRVLGGGLSCGALHEIAAAGEAHVAAATGFAVGIAALSSRSPRLLGEREEVGETEPAEGVSPKAQTRGQGPSPGRSRFSQAGDLSPQAGGGKNIVWIAEDMAALESGAPYGPGFDGFGLAPERLVTVAVVQLRDLLWAMEEALRCRATGCVIGEMRHGALDAVAVRRLSLAAAETGALALILRAAPDDDASTAATRWMVGAAAPSPGGAGSPSGATRGGVILQKRSPPPGALTRHSRCSASASFLSTAAEGGLCLPPSGGSEEKESVPRFLTQLLRNRRGPRGQWILEWSDSDGRFTLAAHAQPVAKPPVHRPHRQVA